MLERYNLLKKVKNIRDFIRVTDEFKKTHQPRSSLVRVVKGHLLAVSHRISNSLQNHLSVIE